MTPAPTPETGRARVHRSLCRQSLQSGPLDLSEPQALLSWRLSGLALHHKFQSGSDCNRRYRPASTCPAYPADQRSRSPPCSGKLHLKFPDPSPLWATEGDGGCIRAGTPPGVCTWHGSSTTPQFRIQQGNMRLVVCYQLPGSVT